MSTTEQIPSWKLEQHEAEAKARRAFRFPADKQTPGVIFKTSDGKRYRIQENGSWKKLEETNG